MYPDPILNIRRNFKSEIETYYQSFRQILLQTLRNELTRPQIDNAGIERYIDQNLYYAGNRAVNSAWLNLDMCYKRGISDAQNQIDRNASLLAVLTKEDKKRTDAQIELYRDAIDLQHKQYKSFILKQIEKNPAVTVFLRNLKDSITQQFIPNIVTVVQTHAGAAYNEAVWSRISETAPYKRWCFVSDFNGREYHKPLDDMIIEIDKPFSVPPIEVTKTKEKPGAEMMYPHDNTNKPDPYHLDDCRCFIAGVFRNVISV